MKLTYHQSEKGLEYIICGVCIPVSYRTDCCLLRMFSAMKWIMSLDEIWAMFSWWKMNNDSTTEHAFSWHRPWCFALLFYIHYEWSIRENFSTAIRDCRDTIDWQDLIWLFIHITKLQTPLSAILLLYK